MPAHREPELSESHATSASALNSALGPLTKLLDVLRVVEVMLNASASLASASACTGVMTATCGGGQ